MVIPHRYRCPWCWGMHGHQTVRLIKNITKYSKIRSNVVGDSVFGDRIFEDLVDRIYTINRYSVTEHSKIRSTEYNRRPIIWWFGPPNIFGDSVFGDRILKDLVDRILKDLVDRIYSIIRCSVTEYSKIRSTEYNRRPIIWWFGRPIRWFSIRWPNIGQPNMISDRIFKDLVNRIYSNIFTISPNKEVNLIKMIKHTVYLRAF